MKQQINLYQSVFRPQKKTFPAAMGASLLGFTLVLFAGLYLVKSADVDALNKQLIAADDNLGIAMNELETLSSQLSDGGKSQVLESEIVRLQDELKKRNAIKAALAEHSLDNRRAFSGLLESLARKHVAGTWLTGVSISDGGEALGFSGKSQASELVPFYIQNLSAESSFSGLSFNVLELTRSEDDPDNLAFLVRSKPEQL